MYLHFCKKRLIEGLPQHGRYMPHNFIHPCFNQTLISGVFRELNDGEPGVELLYAAGRILGPAQHPNRGQHQPPQPGK